MNLDWFTTEIGDYFACLLIFDGYRSDTIQNVSMQDNA